MGGPEYAGHSVEVLGESRGGHKADQIPWPPVPGYLRNHSGVVGIAHALQHGF